MLFPHCYKSRVDTMLGISVRHILSENTVPEMASENGPPEIKTTDYRHGQRLPEVPHRVRTPQTKHNSSNTKRCSNLFPLHSLQQNNEHVVLNEFHCNCPEQLFVGIEKYQCHEHIANDLTRPWPRPGEFY